MKREIMSYVGVLVTILLGTLLHFTYDLSGQNQIVAVFSAVNESTWEHLKLLFWPTFFWTVAEYFVYGKEYPCFFGTKLLAFLAGAVFIATVFYTFSGIVGKDLGFFNVLLFFTGAAVVYCSSDYLFDKGCSRKGELFGILGWILLVAAFVVWTFYPPELGVFLSPV